MFKIKNKTTIIGLLFLAFNYKVYATHCPDPLTSSLKWGVPPSPWVENPFSPQSPQADDNTRFVRANILVAGLGRGVLCTYQTSVGQYSIWWEVLTKIPARGDYNWINTMGGYVCTNGLNDCHFYTAAM